MVSLDLFNLGKLQKLLKKATEFADSLGLFGYYLNLNKYISLNVILS
ncbi:hypothetical protein DALLNEIH_03309 [Bacillus sp. B01(2024)]|nr:hypothetical protein SRCM100169_01212 [Bacillus siamensis]